MSCQTIDLVCDSSHDGSLSRELLYKFFCNNLRLGQWELTRACIETLVQRDGEFDKKLADLLKEIIDEPLTFCYGSSTIPSPFHLSWLCLLEFLRYNKGKVQLPKSVQKRIEFRMLLHFCYSSLGVPLDCLQELDYYHSKVIGKPSLTIPSINATWMAPLKSLVEKQPQIAHEIIHQLLVPTPEYASNNTFFQTIYLDLVKDYLNQLTTLETTLKHTANLESPDETENRAVEMHKKYCESIHQLLVSLDFLSNTMDMDIDELLMNLLHRVESNPCENLSKGSVYSALLAHPTPYLFQRLCIIESDWEHGLHSVHSREKETLARSLVLSETLLSRSCRKDRPEAWKLLYFYARQNHHILEDVVKSCVEFAKLGELEKLTEILSCEEFAPLKVLVLLLAWPYCHSCDGAKKLLGHLWDPDKPTKHVLLDQACAQLEYQVNLVTWCLNKAKPLIVESSSEDHTRAHEMFQSLDSHSILHVLHQSTNIAQLPVDEVLEMLRTRPVFTGIFPSESREEDSEKSFDERAEISRDVALYHGFCALRNFSEVILCSHVDEDDTSSDLRRKIEDAQEHIGHIFPLTFRVEVLENVFSLLFVSSEHLVDEISQNFESDELETLDSRSLRSSRTTSMESFVSLDSRNASPWKVPQIGEQDVSFSGTTSPEPLSNSVDIEQESRTVFVENERSSTKVIPEVRSSRFRELNFDDDVVERQDAGDQEEFQLPLNDKDKLLEFSERKGKGLLVNTALVGPFLDVVKTCLKEVLTLKDDQDEQNRHKIHADWIKTSIPMATLEQRISRLGQYVNEAQWRHQLVSTSCNGNESEEEVPDEAATFSSDGDSDVEQGETDSNLSNRKPRAKPFNERVIERLLSSDGPQQEASIPRLLSSPSSLIYMSMKRDNYGQAKQIIKLFNMEEKESSKAVLFAEEYDKAFQKLTKLEKSKSSAAKSTVKTKSRGLSALKEVASAAAAGIAAVSPASIVEELLMSSSIELASSGLTVTEPAHAHFIHALVCFDFVCAGFTSKRSCRTLLQMAKQHMELAMDIEPSTPYTLRRVAEFLANLQELVSSDDDADSSLFSHTEPLNAKTVKTDQELLARQDDAFIKLEEAIEEGDSVIKSLAEGPAPEMSAVLKFKKTEQKAAVRVAMVEFQSAFSCTKENRLLGGIGENKWLTQYRLDYIQSLYNHVDMLSTWELYWNMTAKERSSIRFGSHKPLALKATNPFVALTQGFDDLAGKPLFERNVPPKSMESMCKKMNVNLIRIIVHNCCPVIPAIGHLRRSDSLLSSRNVVLNYCEEKTKIADPVSLAEELLTKTKQLLEGMKDAATGLVDIQSLVVLSTSPSYVVLLKEIHKFSWVDLHELTTDHDKICFFTNVLNILLTHASITEISKLSDNRGTIPEAHNSEDQTSATWEERLPNLGIPYCRTSYLKKYGYNVGQLGFISAFDLWFTILRTGLPLPVLVQNMSLCSQVSHRYQRYQPKTSDFRVTFAICDGTISAPEIQVLSKLDLQEQLDKITSHYLSNHVMLNMEEEKIFLPELLRWYQKDLTSQLTDIEQSGSHDDWVDLLLRISPFLQEHEFLNLDEIAPQLSVTFVPHSWHFGYRFHEQDVLGQRSVVLTATPSTVAPATGPKYSLTASLSSYLTAKSPLVASLANLSCAPDSSKRSAKLDADEEPPSLLTSFPAPGTRSLEVASPFEFAMNQTDQFPVLQRHITSSFYSLLKFLLLDDLGLVQPCTQTTNDAATAPPDHFRLFILDECSPEVSDLFRRAINYAWCKEDWELFMGIFSTANLRENGGLADPADFVLEKAFQRSAVARNDDDDIAAQAASTLRGFRIPAPNFDLHWKRDRWLLLYRIKDDFLRASIVLQCLHNWQDVSVCLRLLNFCCSKPPKDPDLLESLHKKTKQIQLCAKILHCHSTRAFDGAKVKYEGWKDVVEQSVRDPESVVEVLLDHEEFDLVREWMSIYGYPSHFHQKVHEVYLYYLFKKTPVDITEVYMYLEEINDLAKVYLICESLLSKQLAIPNVVFLINFMTTDLDGVISPARKRELLRQKLGANALLCIPEAHRRSYESLMSQPLLMLEQLLMDTRVEWAAKMFSDLLTELNTNGNYEQSLRKEVSVKAFEKLLVVYASKALEFKIVSYKETDNSQSQTTSGVHSTLSQTQDSLKSSTSKKDHQRHASIGAVHLTSKSSASTPGSSDGNFRIPSEVPSEEEWEPDYKHTVCMICKEVTFNMFVRRHHCRRCGRVVCDGCSPFKHILEKWGRTPVRVCKDCDRMMYEERVKSFDPTIHGGSLPTYLSKAGGHSPSGLTDRSLGPTIVLRSDDDLNFDRHHRWKLTLNAESNKVIRQEFLYEQAPSSALCTSILALHSSSKVCGELLLELCNKLSKKLGVSDEVDNNLLISIIFKLLYHSKLKFTKCGETHGVELCDTYMSRVELVKFLIESNFYDVPSIEDLMSSHTARRLRDKLIENESLALAMEVTMKCSLDAGAVWGAWGLAYLKVGKFKEARQKFGKFLKPCERGKVIQGNTIYLQKIIDILETSPMISFGYLTVGDLEASLTSLRDHSKNPGGVLNLDPKRFEECIFYLNTYGSYAGVVSFYVKHNQLKLACRFILEKRCSSDVFTESFLMPAIRTGQFEVLRDLLKMFDPTLEVWVPHLNGACRYLSKLKYLNILYQVQLLIKDYFRAAMTCIMFYQGLPHHPATNYTELNSRLPYLDEAKTHLDAVRKHQQSKKGTLAMVTNSLNMGETSEDRSRMSVTPSDLANYTNAITLQIEVTKFMQNCYVEGTLHKHKGERRKLGTLFDNAAVKCGIVSEILLAGSTVDDGFSLSCRIIQDFRLPASDIYKVVAEKLATQQKFPEIQVLLNNVAQTRLITDKDHDGVVLRVLGTLAGDEKKWKQAETMIKLLKDEGKKVEAYMRFGRLRTAYLIAVAGERVEDVQAIANVAKENDQTKIYNICIKWLESKAARSERHDVFGAP